MVVTKPETDDKPEDTMIAEKLTEGMNKISVLILTFKAPLIFYFLSETAIKFHKLLFSGDISEQNKQNNNNPLA